MRFLKSAVGFTEMQQRPKKGWLTSRQRVGITTLVLSIVALVSVLFFFVNQTPNLVSSNIRLPFREPSLPPMTCKTPPHNAGDSTQTISSGGLERTFLVHLAPSYGRQVQPLIISYHGYSGNARLMEGATGFSSLADKEGFIAVYPQGYESPPTWYAGNGGLGPTGSEDDLQFTSDMLDYLEKNYCVDSQRIYVTGFSLGGGMAYRVACDLSGRITAIGTASGAYYPLPEGCHPNRPIPVLEIHGLADPSAPYDGNPTMLMSPVPNYLNTWFAIDQCDTTTSNVFMQQPDVTGEEWTHCAAGVQVRHYKIVDGMHSWPDPTVLNGASEMWNFFKQFTIPSAKK
jgi:polyhydroxybutyrate depolymerase